MTSIMLLSSEAFRCLMVYQKNKKTKTKKQCGFKTTKRWVQKHAPWEMTGRLHPIASLLLATYKLTHYKLKDLQGIA